MNVNITIKEKIARLEEPTFIVCGNSDYVVTFSFDEEWKVYNTKTARFANSGNYIDVVFEGDKCTVPVLKNTTGVYIGVFAGDLHTTTPVYVPCKKSIICDSGAPAEPTPDVYAQIMELLNSGGGGGTIKTIGNFESPTVMRDIETGLYMFHGIFTYYAGSDIYTRATLPVLTSVIRDTAKSYIQMYYPYKNQLQYFEVTDTTYEKWYTQMHKVEPTINVSDLQTVLEEIGKLRLDTKYTDVNTLLVNLLPRIRHAKLILNATDSITGAALPNAYMQITTVDKWEDGNYYIKSSATTYNVIVQCTGYATQRVTIAVTPSEAEAGEKIVSVAMVANS